MASTRRITGAMLLALGGAAMAVPAGAQDAHRRALSIAEYNRMINSTDRTSAEDLSAMNWYFFGLSGGVGWLAMDFEDQGIKPLFCLPDGALNTRDKHLHSVASEMRRRPDLWHKDSPQPLARLAIAAMRNQFPCR